MRSNRIDQDLSRIHQESFRIYPGFIQNSLGFSRGFIQDSSICLGFIQNSLEFTHNSSRINQDLSRIHSGFIRIYPGFIQGLFVVIKRFTSEILKPTSLPLLDPSSWNSLASLLPLFFNRSWGTAGFCWRKLAALAPTWVKIVALFYSKKPKWAFWYPRKKNNVLPVSSVIRPQFTEFCSKFSLNSALFSSCFGVFFFRDYSKPGRLKRWSHWISWISWR